MTSNAARPAPFTRIRGFRAIGSIRQPAWRALSAARGESLAAFDERCIPAPPQRGCRVGDPGAGGVAPPSNTPGILSRRALPAGRLARLGATPDFHHGLLGEGCFARGSAEGARAAGPAGPQGSGKPNPKYVTDSGR